MSININITNKAKNHLTALLKENQSIILGVKNSGCSGFSYIVDILNSDIKNYKNKELNNYIFNEVPFLIANEDIDYLKNLNIDYVNDGLNSRIVYENPQAKQLCGCGTSFSL